LRMTYGARSRKRWGSGQASGARTPRPLGTVTAATAVMVPPAGRPRLAMFVKLPPGCRVVVRMTNLTLMRRCWWPSCCKALAAEQARRGDSDSWLCMQSSIRLAPVPRGHNGGSTLFIAKRSRRWWTPSRDGSRGFRSDLRSGNATNMAALVAGYLVVAKFIGLIPIGRASSRTPLRARPSKQTAVMNRPTPAAADRLFSCDRELQGIMSDLVPTV
jgi:hypothetical protein